MRRYLLPILTRPFLPRLPCLSATERRALVERCLRHAEAADEEGEMAVAPYVFWLIAAFFVMIARLQLSGRPVFDLAGVWVCVRYVVVPLGLIVLLYAFVLSISMKSRLLAELKADGLCQRCGYDLRHTATTCPECGKQASWPDWS